MKLFTCLSIKPLELICVQNELQVPNNQHLLKSRHNPDTIEIRVLVRGASQRVMFASVPVELLICNSY